MINTATGLNIAYNEKYNFKTVTSIFGYVTKWNSSSDNIKDFEYSERVILPGGWPDAAINKVYRGISSQDVNKYQEQKDKYYAELEERLRNYPEIYLPSE